MKAFIIFVVTLCNAQDWGQSFANFYHLGESPTEEHIQTLKESKVLFIPGFFSNLATYPIDMGYFRQAKNYLDSVGVENERVATYSVGPSIHSVEILKEQILYSPKKVLVIGHSKGNLDFLETLYHHPELMKNIEGLISIQAPFHGSPVADALVENPYTRFFFTGFLKSLAGDISSLHEFQTQKGQEKLVDFESLMSRRTFPFLSFASKMKKGDSMSLPLFQNFSRIISDIESDGLVPTQSAIFPKCPYIEFEGMDHTDPVLDIGNRINRDLFFKALLKTYFHVKENEQSLP